MVLGEYRDILGDWNCLKAWMRANAFSSLLESTKAGHGPMWRIIGTKEGHLTECQYRYEIDSAVQHVHELYGIAGMDES
jgi:hypothetical protein